MKYKLTCTTYNQTDNGLVLRNNFTESVENDKGILEIIERWQLPDCFRYPSINSVSEILEGVMVGDIIVHVRIVRFGQ